MERTSIIVIALCFILLGLWTFVLVPKLYPAKPGATTPTNAAPATVTGTNQASATSTPPTIVESPASALKPVENTNVTEELVALGNENARYTFSSHGGGIKLIELLKYPESVSTRREKQPQTNRVATLNTFTLAP